MKIIGKTGAFLEHPAVCFLGRAILLWKIISKSSEAADPTLNPQRKAGYSREINLKVIIQGMYPSKKQCQKKCPCLKF